MSILSQLYCTVYPTRPDTARSLQDRLLLCEVTVCDEDRNDDADDSNNEVVDVLREKQKLSYGMGQVWDVGDGRRDSLRCCLLGLRSKRSRRSIYGVDGSRKLLSSLAPQILGADRTNSGEKGRCGGGIGVR